MRVLGIDPGSHHTGFGVLEGEGPRWRARAHGRISCRQKQALAQRLRHLVEELSSVAEHWRPEVAVLEQPFHGASSRSALVLAQARGALLATLAGCGMEIAEYSPAEVKMAVTGSGRASKEQVARMVVMQLDLDPRGLSADAADALAVALCFAHRHRLDLAVTRAIRRK